MNYQCFSDNCVSKPVAYCLCRGIPSLFCVEDSINHSKNYKDHRIFDIVTCPLSETQIDLLKISNLKNTLKNTQKSLLSESIEIVKLIHVINQNSQNEIGKLIKDCDEIILRVALHHRNNEVINHYSTMSRFNSDKTINNLKYFYDNMMRNYKQLKDQIREALDISKFNINDSTGDEIIFFTNLTKQSIFLNLDSLKIEWKEHNSLPKDIKSEISICELPNKSKFCYGLFNSRLTFIIDYARNAKLLPNGKKNYALDSKYHNNFVYAIGGENKLAEKFNLLENKWESCETIPYNYNFIYSRSAILADKIIIVGLNHGKVIIYDINQNNYQELAGIELVKNVHKFAFSTGNKVYIGESKKNIYESVESDLSRWNLISTANPVTDNYQISYYSLVDESVFFINVNIQFFSKNKHSLYEFNLRSKDIILIQIY